MQPGHVKPKKLPNDIVQNSPQTLQHFVGERSFRVTRKNIIKALLDQSNTPPSPASCFAQRPTSSSESHFQVTPGFHSGVVTAVSSAERNKILAVLSVQTQTASALAEREEEQCGGVFAIAEAWRISTLGAKY